MALRSAETCSRNEIPTNSRANIGLLLVTVRDQPHPLMQDEQTKLELADLFARMAKGDTEAFSKIYDLTADMVYGLALRIVRSRVMAEEVTQEVFLQVWRQADSYDAERGSVKAWVATLAHRRAVDAVRRSQGARDREGKAPVEHIQPDVAEKTVDDDERARVRDALSTLTDLQFEAIWMAFYRGLTYREVAEHLDTPLGTVKSRMRDALLRLREIMEDDDV